MVAPVERVRLGVVGAGNIADLNVAGYIEHPGCDVVAVCDVHEEAARNAAERWGAPKVYTELDKMLEDPEINAVEVLTPTHLHFDHVFSSLQAGKHVSVQKPVTNSVDEARVLARAAAEADLTFRISECFVHYPPLELAKKFVKEGAIGHPTAIRIKTVVGQTDAEFQANLNADGYGWRLDTRSPGGHLFDDMVHKFAMAMWLVDQDIKSVQALVNRRDYFFEPCVAMFEYEDPELLGVLDVQYAPKMWMRSSYYGADEFFEIQGDEGMIWVTRATGEMLDLPPVLLYQGTEGDYGTKEIRDVDSDWGAGFKRSSAHFVDSLIAGTPAQMTVESAIKVLQLCFAIYQAGLERRPIDPSTITGY
ncbi:MAG: Gfo/Idh/MocA family oxidoreductase, partial [Acidimicrobiales bacterium]